MKKVLITGASGFVGANLARKMIQEGHRVYLLLRPGFASWRIEEIKKEVNIGLVDLTDEKRLTSIVKQIKPDWVFHLATHGAYSYQTDIEQMIATNIRGTVNLLQASFKAGVKALVNISSSSEYGYNSYRPSEREPVTPNSEYAATKAAGTLWCGYFGEKYHMYVPTLRLYSVYGPFEQPGRLMPTLLRHIHEGKLPPLVNPNVARDFIYVDDVITAMLRVVKKRNQKWGPIYNVGSSKQTRLKQLVKLVRKMWRIKAKPEWSTMKDRQWDTTRWRANINKIESDYNWKPDYNLEQGLKKMYRWLNQSKWFKYYQE